MKVTCDSDVLSNFGRKSGRGAKEVADSIRSGELALNAISLFETRGGMEDEARVRDFDRRFGHLEVLPLNRQAAIRAGDLWRALRKRGTPVAVRDLLMAAIADIHGRRLLTADKDFSQLVELGLDVQIIEKETRLA